MRYAALLLLMILCQSCFLFNDFHKSSFPYAENGRDQPLPIIVPKKFSRMELQTDPAGNKGAFYHYSDGAVLYFAQLGDTATSYQYIDYSSNVPKELYQTVFFKGVDSSNRYWRETRFGHFKAGYFGVEEGRDGVFDSAINYFTLHMAH